MVAETASLLVAGVSGAGTLYLLRLDWSVWWLTFPTLVILVATLLKTFRQSAMHKIQEHEQSRREQLLRKQRELRDELYKLTIQPPENFLEQARNLFPSHFHDVRSLRDKFAGHGQAAIEEETVADAICSLMETILSLLEAFHRLDEDGFYTANLMLPIEVSGANEDLLKRIEDEELRFTLNTETITRLGHVLRLEPDLCVSSTGEEPGYVEPFALPVPRSEDLGSEGEWLLLPGAPWAFHKRFSLFETDKCDRWFENYSALSQTIENQVQAYMEDVAYSAFLSVAIPVNIDEEGDELPVAVLNVDAYNGRFFRGTPPVDQFIAVITPFLVLLTDLASLYRGVKPPYSALK
jgi:hypothetical protein